MTIESKDEIIKLIWDGGVDHDTGYRVTSIWQYDNVVNGGRVYAIFASERFNDIYTSPYVRNPVCLWDILYGTTDEGLELLKEKEVKDRLSK